jgi:hypothetical protein
VISDNNRLCKKYGNCNLLVIGSPASNHLARIINADAIFRFNLQKEFTEKLENILKGLPAEKDREVLERKKRDNLDDLKQLMRRFCAYGIVDPLIRDVRGFALAPDVDYATITFARNPYYQGDDFRYVAIMVAGFHHPGTVSALRCLSKPYDKQLDFLDHPYGGVIEVKISLESAWEDRMHKVRCSWDTDGYTPKKLLEGLEAIRSSGWRLMEIDPTKIDQCIELLKSLKGTSDSA